MRFKFLAISDMHLGEPTSVFYYDSGLKELIKELRKLLRLGSTEKARVDELILAGDTVDRCLAASKQILQHGPRFLLSLQSFLDIEKVVYLPGNHDHTIWTEYSEQQYSEQFHCTEHNGEVLSERGRPLSPHLNQNARDLLSILACRDEAHPDRPGLTLANPLYAQVVGDRTYVFAHGTHFRWDVTRPVEVEEIFKGVGLLEAMKEAGRPFPDLPKADLKALSLVELEEFVSPLVDFLWASANDDPNPPRDRFWYIVTWLSGRFNNPHRTADQSLWLTRGQLHTTNQIRELKEHGFFRESSLTLWRKFFRDPMLAFLENSGILQDNVTFVYGDTHDGGFKDDFPVSFNGRVVNLRIYNTGAWIVDLRGSHPPCHIFALQDQSRATEETMMDISFSQATEGGEPLLDVAGRDIEEPTASRWDNLHQRLLKFGREHKE